jgi:hypothetical protein
MLNWGQNRTHQQSNLLPWAGPAQTPQKPNGSLVSDVAKTISNDIHKIHILILWRPHKGSIEASRIPTSKFVLMSYSGPSSPKFLKSEVTLCRQFPAPQAYGCTTFAGDGIAG